jgi:WD40 repeat protein
VARLGTARFRAGRAIRSLSYAPDGRTLAVSTRPFGGTLLCDARSGRELRSLPSTDVHTDAGFAPDGALLTTDRRAGRFTLWDPATGKKRTHFPGSITEFRSFAFSPDGKLLLARRERFALSLWEVASGKELRRLEARGEVLCVGFSPDGRTLAAGGDAPLRLWDGAKAKPRDLAQEYVLCLAFAPDGKVLAAAGDESNEAVLWDVATGQVRHRLKGHTRPVRALAFAPDGRSLATAGWGETVRLWDVASGKELRVLRGHSDIVRALAWSPDGRTLVSGGDDGVFCFWDAAAGKERHPSEGHRHAVVRVAVAPDGRTVASVGHDGAVLFWDPLAGRPRQKLRLLGRLNRGLAWSADGKLLAAGGLDQPAEVWEAPAFKERRPFAGPASVESLDLSPDGRLLACGLASGELHLHATTTGRVAKSLKTGAARVVAFAPDGKALVTVGPGGAGLWEIASGKFVHRFKDEGETSPAILSAHYSPNGRLLAGMNVVGAVCVWDAGAGRQVLHMGGDGADTTCVAFAPDSRTLATGHLDRKVRLWDLARGRRLATLAGHQGAVTSVAFFPDGRRLASGSEDTTILVWDISPHRPRQASGKAPAAEKLQALWADLAGADAARAYRSLWELAGSGEAAVELLGKRLRPIPALDAARLRRLVTDLDAPRFAVREQAERELLTNLEVAESALRRALEGGASLEMRRRIERLLAKLQQPTLPPAGRLQALRGVAVLELIGTPQARKALETLAGGAEGVWLTREAEAALRRLRRRAVTP